ncbi:hypothetical protein LZ554_005971 [Drepanopeziza brunnea f. sp. 'monogermtubi']|nr:hypothetical protein LZ554_005971 [Drepanopeziza brunnea f. sp. 'monogermtubi']
MLRREGVRGERILTPIVEDDEITSANPTPQTGALKVESVSSDEIVSANPTVALNSYGPPGIRGFVSSRNVVVCAACSALGGLLFGYDQGVISVILGMPQFLDRFPEVSDKDSRKALNIGAMTGMIELGALFGALNQGWIADKISRRYSIMVAVFIFTLGSALQTFSKGYGMLVAARLVGGVGIGMLSMVVPLYISEISPPEMRGSLLVFEELSIVIGIVISFWVSYGTRSLKDNLSWQVPFGLQIIPGLLLGASTKWLLPFSPRWLASKGKENEALAVLAKLRRLPDSDPRVQREWVGIIAESTFQKQMLAQRHPDLTAKTRCNRLKLEFASWMDCLKPGCLSRTHVGAGLMFFQQFVGINAMIYYSPSLFKTMGLDYENQLKMSGLLNATQLIGVISSLWAIDRVGRRTTLLWGSICMLIYLSVIAGLVGKFSSDWPSNIGTLTFNSKDWLWNFIVGLITPLLIEKTGFGTFVFFAVTCSASWVWTYFVVPETNGKLLEQMDEVFGDRGNVAETEMKGAILLQTRERTKAD